ncbi:hypothetical protein CAEBREN_25381 [Caenorhabditis brenneri]|uniref:Uncharacterized protein n=1 Tax=Caenorhabditis brenneri TaxID=135651 RepID=G0MD96_CAEBE|nr:hypothetical protein CAEBREN_25381 [Caenorhabditis brenneri]
MNYTNSQHAEYPDTFGSPSTSSSSRVDPNDQRPQQSLVRPLCKVCGDRSLGINYGVVSCSACKKFFYRAIENWPQKIEKCKYRGYKCSVNVANRTKCLACRLKKCLEVGMTRVAKHLDGGLNLVLQHFRTVDPSFSAPEYVEPVEGFEEEEDKENMEWEEDEESAQKVQKSITIPAEAWTDDTWNATDMTLAELNNDRYDDDDNIILAQDSHEPSDRCNEWNYDDDGDDTLWDPNQGFDAIPDSEEYQLGDPSASQTMSEAGPEIYYDEAYLMEHSQELTVVGHSSMNGSSSGGPIGTGTGGRTQTVKEYIESISLSLQNSHPSAPPPAKPKRPVHQAQQKKAPVSPKPLLFSRYEWERPPRDLSFLGEHSYAKKSDDPYCKVCSAPANRSYFGVKACEDCKTAFAEYVVVAKCRPMECGTNGKGATCDSCEYCHFQKCVRAGMRGKIPVKRIKKAENVQYPFCEVCGKRPIGVRFGVWSCDGCKFRFNRLTAKGQYPKECDYKGICEINSASCISCWFGRCMEVGMQREGMDLKPPPVEPEESNKEAEDSAKIILKFYDTCAFTVVKMKRLSPKKFNMLTGLDDRHIDRLNAWQMYSYEMASDMHSTGEFLRGIPRMDEIEMEERLMLLKNNYFPIYLLNIARALSLRGMYLRDGRMITLDVLELLFGDPLLKQLIDFVESFTVISCSDAETALAIPLLFCRHDKASQKLWEIRRYYTKLLSKNSSERVSKLFEKLVPKLNQISNTYYNELQFVRDNVQFLNLCPIFMEMFEIQFPSDSTTPFNTEPLDDVTVPLEIDLTCE